jgi:hypothetical protein
MELPSDLANGMVSALIENMPSQSEQLRVSYLTASPKPRVVKLAITPDGTDRYGVGGSRRPAKIFKIHIELGGVAGVVAPVVGKQPSDIRIFVMTGPVPAFLKLEAALYQQGPVWVMQLASPAW